MPGGDFPVEKSETCILPTCLLMVSLLVKKMIICLLEECLPLKSDVITKKSGL